MEKICTMCGESKPLDEFYAAKLGAFGRAARCKHCVSVDCARRYELNRDRMLQSRREYRERNSESVRERERLKYREKHADYAEKRAAYIRENGLKVAARAAVQQAVRSGSMQRARVCSDCGSRTKTTAHHHNGYSREHWLDVEWLCPKCHMRRHSSDHEAP